MTGSMIVKPATAGAVIFWPRPESRRVLKTEGERVPLSPYWLRLANKGAVVHVAHAAEKSKE